MYWFDAKEGEFNVAVALARTPEDDHGFMCLRFVDVEGAVVAIYEIGIACFELNGELRWHFAHGDYGRRFLRVEGDGLLYRDADGAHWSYRLRSN